jgi:hypothetical protein
VLQAILSKMQTAKGSVQVGGSIAYVPQTPWVQNLNLKDNILFGLEYDEEKYKAVIHAAALELDLQILPKGKSWLLRCFGGIAGKLAVISYVLERGRTRQVAPLGSHANSSYRVS